MKIKNFFEVKSLKNLTTEINMLKKQHDELTEAVEYSPEHVIFELDERSCNKRQLTNLEGVIHLNGTQTHFIAQGKISDVMKIDDGRIKVTVELHSFDKKIWSDFVEKLSEEQRKLDLLFNSMRGE